MNVLGLSVVALVLLASTVHAEYYIGGVVGSAQPQNAEVQSNINRFLGTNRNIPTPIEPSSVAGGDIQLDQGLAVGAKQGFFFPGLSFLGFETEGYLSNLKIPSQPVLTQLGLPMGGRLLALSGAANLVLRLPFKTLQPYVSAGPVVHGVKARIGAAEEWGYGFGWQAAGGARLYLTRNVAIFGEYKYFGPSTIKFHSSDLDAKLQMQMIVGGVTLHFGRTRSRP